MELIHIVVLALIQGLTEFLPISSSAHLILPSELLGWPDQGLAFDVSVHVGSLGAVVWYFRADLRQLATEWFKNPRADTEPVRLVWYLVYATIPACVVGLLLDDWIETHLRSIQVIATTTIVFGLLLGWADRHRGGSSLSAMNLRSALLIGCAQALALIPGTSRSGITITAALGLGFSRQAAARFSFLMSVPIIALSGGYKGLQLILGDAPVQWSAIVGGMTLSFISAFACIHFFLSWIDRIGMKPFVIYRVLLGIVLFSVSA